MKVEFEMRLYDNTKNRVKANFMNVIDIMFDDMDNVLPDSWFALNGEAGIDIPWGSKFKFTIEVMK